MELFAEPGHGAAAGNVLGNDASNPAAPPELG
jgi:hypothetical protein